MPSEHDDSRERQLAALRRYVSDLDVRRQHNGQARLAEERRWWPTWPWLLVTLVLMGVSLGGGVAIGVNRDGYREVLGVDVITVEDGAGWMAFLRGLVARGLTGVCLVISDDHQGLVEAVASVLGASWQRSSVHNACGRERPARHPHRWERALAA